MSIESAAGIDVAATHRPARTVAKPRAFALRRIDVLLMLALFVMAMVPRAAWIAYNDRPPKGLNDPTEYLTLGDFIADGDGYRYFSGEPTAYYPVGYPAALAGVRKLGDIFGWGHSIFAAKMLGGVAGAITVVLVYLLAARLLDRRVGFWAGALLAIFPSQVFYTGTIHSEPLFTMLLVAAALVLLWNPWDREGMSWRRLLVFGLLLSAATMTRGVTLALPFVLLVVWWFYLRSHKRAVVQTLIVLAGVAVLTVPWSIRNSIRLHTIVGASTNLGDDLCIGNFNGATGAFTLRGKCFDGTEGMGPDEAEVYRNREGLRIAVKDVVQHPLRMPQLIGLKAFWTFYQDADALQAAQSYDEDRFIWQPLGDVLTFSADAIYFASGLLAIVGVAAFALSKDIRRAVLVLIALYVLLIPLVFFGNPRFHFPGIPFVAIVAAATVVAFWDRRHRALLELRR